MPIKVLAPEVIAKIAAGEVIERPASVVKELVENSLDAGATHIIVEVEGAGVRSIRVVDNGAGMPADEIELAFTRYATSKVVTEADLDGINTLGFRGEALPSIAAVAQVDLITRTANDLAGTYLKIRGGRILEKGSRGCPLGTSVSVRDLFRDVPARLKFLRSPATENSHIANLVSHYSLSFPEVRFNLVIDGHLDLRSSGNGVLRDAVIELYGLEVGQAMLEVNWSEPGGCGISVSGYVSPPELARASRAYLSLFVNRRWVQSRMLSYAVEDAYRGLLMSDKHPMAVINVRVPPQDVDVNVHPTKTEVRFRDERAVFAAVQKSIRSILLRASPAPRIEVPPAPAAPASPQEALSLFDAVATRPAPPPMIPEVKPFAVSLPILRVLGQLGTTYIIAEGPDGMYLIDQHAAHERVLFEQIQRERQGRALEVQGLLEPLALELSPRQEESLKSLQETLTQYGFELEPFGPRTYLLRCIPAVLREQSVLEAVMEILDSASGSIPGQWEEKIAISLACHGAVKAGQVLSPQEMQELVRQLEETAAPNTCPHGRPTMMHLSSQDLGKQFGRR